MWKTKVDTNMKESLLFKILSTFVITSYTKNSERVMLISELMFKTDTLNNM